ncbi:hypothetical protein VTL71DRAFT_13561 [Oculimacula yallundae]|uniref:Uncharacterized protein n=1 Tax=Oculimacula yallundae TaxID=86028 RepID=A0ABR4CKQ5_9HELO
MPRQTRSSAKAAEGTASQAAVTTPNPKPKSKAGKRTALQPNSGNSQKRPRSSTFTKEKTISSEQVEPEPETDKDEPAPKRQTTTPKSKAVPSKKKKKGNWDVEGVYEIECTNRFQPIDASGFMLSLHYKRIADSSSDEHSHSVSSSGSGSVSMQLYASFKFGIMKGVMRLCPIKAITSPSTDPSLNPVSDSEAEAELDSDDEPEAHLLMLPEFEKACHLAEDEKTGPKSKEWLMRWRGRTGDNVAGGESRTQGQFVFRRETGKEGGVKFTFAILLEGSHLLFEGTKKVDATADEESEVDIEAEWRSFFRPEWEEGNIVRQQDKYNDWDPPPEIYSWDPPTGGVVKAKNKPGPNPGAYPKPKSSFIEAPPLYAWDVSGSWEITAAGNGECKLSTFKLCLFMENNPFHSKSGRQLWGRIKIGREIRGVLRLCPSMSEGNKDCSLAEFEEACSLSDGVWPGPTSEGGTLDWQFRWRGVATNRGITEPAGDDQNASMTFGRSADGTLSLRGTFMWGGEEIPIIGFRKGPGKPRSITDPTIARIWLAYEPPCYFGGRDCTFLSEMYDPVAEAKEEEWEKNEGSAMRPRYPPGGIPDYIEPLPAWAWDVTGEWAVDSPSLRTNLGIPAYANMSISIRLANSPHVGPQSRRLYAHFRFGDAMEGCMRFAPVAQTQLPSATPDTLADFEKNTHLGEGVWPGPLPQGIELWKMRFRALDHRTEEVDPRSEERQSQVLFGRGDDGRLCLKREMVIKETKLPFDAVRVVEEKYTNGNEATAQSAWQRYARKR